MVFLQKNKKFKKIENLSNKCLTNNFFCDNIYKKRRKMDKTVQVYNFIVDYIKQNNNSPTVREICSHFNFNSTSSGDYYLKRLENDGKITRAKNKNRAIELTNKAFNTVSLPLLGTIAAGKPILAEENLTEQFSFSENLFSGTDLFLLKVKGDSMVNVGIYNNDYVVISKQSIANNGEIIACLIDNEATVKRYYKENHYFRLQPENSFMQPIYTDHLVILGKVVGLIRNKI